ncbi:lipase family protein [Paenibacillus sp. NPDC056579]|uniref:lipase family protein n=1 Tax=unclassified Paenibacillus TaxID=185978 RepID=UPI001EF92CFC|nr:lipase family protein [Paenibacillus sp. H1-7]
MSGKAAKAVTDRAIFLAAAVYQAVQQYKNGGKCILPKGYRKVAVLGGKKDPYLGMILQSATTVIIVFRGTESAAELLTNTDMQQVRFPFVPSAGRTHRGFTRLYEQAARDSIMRCLRKQSGDKALWIAGHSLGGAIAAMCALDTAVNSKFKQPKLYTYAAPKTGDAVFASAFGRKIRHSVRVVNESDLVPVLPPSLSYANYRHVKGAFRLRFSRSTIIGNHTIRSYYQELAKLDTGYSRRLQQLNPGYCPET